MAPRASSAAALSLDLTDAETFVDHDPHAYFREVRRGRPCTGTRRPDRAPGSGSSPDTRTWSRPTAMRTR